MSEMSIIFSLQLRGMNFENKGRSIIRARTMATVAIGERSRDIYHKHQRRIRRIRSPSPS